MPVRDVAALLLDNRISAVPVVNSGGIPIGMVSEGDLIGRGEKERNSRIDWWLALAAGSQPLSETFRARLQATDRTARDVMSAPLVTVTEDTEVSEIARLLSIHHIKRVPVVRDGRLVGLVSRADLLRVVAAAPSHAVSGDTEEHRGFLAGLIGDHHLAIHETVAAIKSSKSTPKPDESQLSAVDFRQLVEDFQRSGAEHQSEERLAAARQRRDRARQLIDSHVFDEGWRQLMHAAREAAVSGQKECMLLRFPNQLCIDDGRAINIESKDWPVTLRGRPAEIYLRWERD
jgi:CBS domain-containing protein